MIIETMIFSGQDGVDESGRDLIQRNQAALLPVALEDTGQKFRLDSIE